MRRKYKGCIMALAGAAAVTMWVPPTLTTLALLSMGYLAGRYVVPMMLDETTTATTEENPGDSGS